MAEEMFTLELTRLELVGAVASLEAVMGSARRTPPEPLRSAASKMNTALASQPETQEER